MGSNDGLDNEKPVHTVYVDAFYIDIYEVTNAQYKKFVEATGHREPKGYGFVDGEVKDGFEPWKSPYFNGDNQPVVCVSWHDAMAYAQWVGKRLPTEAEWEYAARDGLEGKKYPWGDEAPDAGGTYRANYYTGDDDADGYQYTAPVKGFAPNGYGLYDMAGNVWEWCLDEYQADFYSKSPRTDPIAGESIPYVINNFTSVGTKRVLRGGSWVNYNYYVRVASRYRVIPDVRNATFGFRCVSAR
jgi:formylglycine-generating enzyme required for sulfatase activity